jgi:phthiocerol/phenolphthiocerol synthesis type-I polyketide synthase E
MTGEATVVGAPAAGEHREGALVVLRAGGGQPPLVCVHGAAGHLRLFGNLARHLDPDRPVYGLRSVGHELPPHPPYRSFEEMAHRYARELSELAEAGPYLVLGECDGGQLAYELARQLDARGDLGLLVLVDSFGPGEPGLVVPGWAYGLGNSVRMLGFHLRAVAGARAGERRTYVATRLRRIVARIRARASARGGRPPEPLLRQHAFREAAGAYRPTPYGGGAVLLRGARLPWGTTPPRDLGWARLVADLKIVELPAYFGTCLLAPVVGQLAEALEQAAAALSRERA